MSLESNISQGKLILAAVTGSYGTASLLTLVFGAERFDTATNAITFVVQTSLTVWLFYAMWTGRQWARWTFAALLGVGLVYLLLTSMQTFSWRLGLFLAYQMAVAVLLCFPDSVDAFIDDQKRRRKEPIQSPQRNAGSRPPSGDSSASETPSSLGPRG